MSEKKQELSYFDSFLQKYCAKYEITEQEARKHALVKEMAAYYRMIELEEKAKTKPQDDGMEYFDSDIFDGIGGGC